MDDARRHTLLVPLDGSVPGEGPLEIADAIAAAIDAEIHVLLVSHDLIPDEDVPLCARVPTDWMPRVTLHHAIGDAVPEILRAVDELEASAVLLSSHGKTRDLSVPAGHVTLDVLCAAPCPVYVVRSALDSSGQAHRCHHVRRILVPLDGSTEALFSVQHAASLASRYSARLMLLHVITDEPDARRAPFARSYCDQLQYEGEAWGEEFMRSAFAGLPQRMGLGVELALRRGDPGNEIARFASDQDCDLIVIAWAGCVSPGRARVVQTLLDRATCPLLFIGVRVREQLAAPVSASGRRVAAGGQAR
jgi:nucleotide-binding universal stress UspA family protein